MRKLEANGLGLSETSRMSISRHPHLISHTRLYAG